MLMVTLTPLPLSAAATATSTRRVAPVSSLAMMSAIAQEPGTLSKMTGAGGASPAARPEQTRADRRRKFEDFILDEVDGTV
jgi:hypothetical protein